MAATGTMGTKWGEASGGCRCWDGHVKRAAPVPAPGRRAKGRRTGPEAKEILGIARLDGVHGAVLDAHNGARSVQRHCVAGGRRGCVGEGGGLERCWGSVSAVSRVGLRQGRAAAGWTVVRLAATGRRRTCGGRGGGGGGVEVKVKRAWWHGGGAAVEYVLCRVVGGVGRRGRVLGFGRGAGRNRGDIVTVGESESSGHALDGQKQRRS